MILDTLEHVLYRTPLVKKHLGISKRSKFFLDPEEVKKQDGISWWREEVIKTGDRQSAEKQAEK